MYGNILLALVFSSCGIAAFIYFGNLQRQFEAKLQHIRMGDVRPETLTVVSKRDNTGKRTSQQWVVFRSSRQPELVYPAPPDLFNIVNPGSTVTGYYFPDGYFIPQYDTDRDAGTPKWVFFSFLFLLGVLVFLLTLTSKGKRKNAA